MFRICIPSRAHPHLCTPANRVANTHPALQVMEAAAVSTPPRVCAPLHSAPTSLKVSVLNCLCLRQGLRYAKPPFFIRLQLRSRPCAHLPVKHVQRLCDTPLSHAHPPFLPLTGWPCLVNADKPGNSVVGVCEEDGKCSAAPKLGELQIFLARTLQGLVGWGAGWQRARAASFAPASIHKSNAQRVLHCSCCHHTRQHHPTAPASACDRRLLRHGHVGLCRRRQRLPLLPRLFGNWLLLLQTRRRHRSARV